MILILFVLSATKKMFSYFLKLPQGKMGMYITMFCFGFFGVFQTAFSGFLL